MAAAAVELAARMRKLLPSLSDREPTSRIRDTWRYGRKGSLAVIVSGPRRGNWFDHEAGVGGDALALVAHLRGCSMREAWEWALAWLETTPAFQPARPAEGGADSSTGRHGTAHATTVGLARRVWGEAVQPVGTLVEAYLRGRGLALPVGAPVRFHPACPRGAERWPAMLCLMSDPVTGEPCGVHRTFLARDASGKAPEGPNGERPKMMAGRSGVVRLVPDQEVGTGLGIAEGIEKALAVMQRSGWRPVWVPAGAGAIRTFPVLPGIESLTVFADMDGPGIAAARACCQRWSAGGREATWRAPPAGDWDDALPPRGPAA
jgi:putative DNA primase/helicase